MDRLAKINIYIITGMIVQKIFRKNTVSTGSITRLMKFRYLKQNYIQEIKDRYPGQSIIDKTKILLQIATKLCVKGFQESKIDYLKFKEIAKIKAEDRTLQQKQQYRKINSDILKAIPAFTLLFAPFGSPLFLIYLQLFPNLTPTWILTQKIYHRLQTVLEHNKRQALDYFINKYKQRGSEALSIQIANNYQAISKQTNNAELREISNLLFGLYRDGTFYLTDYSPLRLMNLQFKFLFTKELSKYLMLMKIEDYVKYNTYYAKQCSSIQSFQGKLALLLKKQIDLLNK